MGRIKISWFWCIVFLLSFLQVNGQFPNFWSITAEDGLPSNTIYQINQDDNGFLWIATDNGICRHDGKNTVHFQHPLQKDNEIIYLFVSPNNTIWYVNLSNQIFYISNNEVHYFTKDEELSFNFRDIIWHKSKMFILESRDSTSIVHFIDQKELNDPNHLLSHYNHTTIEEYGAYKFHVQEPINDSSKSDLILLNRAKDNTDVYNYTKKENVKNFAPLSVFKDKKYLQPKTIGLGENLYCTNFQFEIKIWSPTFTEPIQEFTLEKLIINVQLVNDKLFVCGTDVFGLIDYKKNQFQNLNLGTYSPNYVFYGKEENLFIGTANNGVLVIPNLAMINPDNVQNNTNEEISIIKNDEENHLVYSGTNKGRIQIYDLNKRITQHITLPQTGKIYDIEMGRNILFGTNNHLYSKNPTKDKFTLLDPISGSIKSIHQDASGYYWIANYNELIKFHESELFDILIDQESFRVKHLLMNNKFTEIDSKNSNKIWLGGRKGLFVLNSEVLSQVYYQDSLSYNVSKLKVVNDSTVWLADVQLGLLKIVNSTIVDTFYQRIQFPENLINDIKIENDTIIWLASLKGVFKINLNNDSIMQLNLFHGLASNKCNTIEICGEDIWVGTEKGITVFPNNNFKKNSIPPRVNFLGIKVLEAYQPIKEKYVLSFHENDIEIDFIGINFKSRGNPEYEYKLNGHDKEWIKTSTSPVRYSNLNPGKYVFSVSASNEDGLKNNEPKSIIFEIHPPWWQTWWFRILSIITIVSLLYYFINRRFKRAKEQQKLENEFQQKVNDLRMQAIQTQMNPHFIFNSLSAIQLFLTTNEQEKAMVYLARFAKLIRLIFEHSKEKMVTLNEEIELLELYMNLENLRFKGKASTEIVLSEELKKSREEYLLPPLLIQPIVENAYKHGLLHKNKDGVLKVMFSIQNKRLKCQIEDNGIGFEKAKELNQWRSGKHKSSGIKSAMDRLEILHMNDPNFKMKEDYFKIENLRENSSSDVGTRITIVF